MSMGFGLMPDEGHRGVWAATNLSWSILSRRGLLGLVQIDHFWPAYTSTVHRCGIPAIAEARLGEGRGCRADMTNMEDSCSQQQQEHGRRCDMKMEAWCSPDKTSYELDHDGRSLTIPWQQSADCRTHKVPAWVSSDRVRNSIVGRACRCFYRWQPYDEQPERITAAPLRFASVGALISFQAQLCSTV
jgi:hypothetical protein